jgi:hypothetical protein
MRSLLINYLENADLVLENNYFGSQKDDAINLAGVQITGHLDFEGSQALWNVNMDSLRAALTMRRVRFQKVWLANVKIEVLLDASDATIPGEFRMINIQVGNDLQMYKSTLTTVLLQSARIDGVEHRGTERRRSRKRTSTICGSQRNKTWNPELRIAGLRADRRPQELRPWSTPRSD